MGEWWGGNGRPAGGLGLSNSYDASIKELFERRPADWLTLAGLNPGGPVRLVDANLATVTADVDRAIWVEDPWPWLAHIEIQASRDPDLARRLYRYNAMLDLKFGLPVESIVILLRPQADGPSYTGLLERSRHGWPPYLSFRYRVVRVWELPAEELLRGSLATLPLALIADAPAAKLPGVARRVEERIRSEATRSEARVLRAIAELLLGLNRSKGDVDMLFNMDWIEESSVYKAMVEKGIREGRERGIEEGVEQGLKQGVEQGERRGRIGEVRSLIWKLGEKRLGEPTAEVRDEVERVEDLEALEGLLERVLQARGWEDAMAG